MYLVSLSSSSSSSSESYLWDYYGMLYTEAKMIASLVTAAAFFILLVIFVVFFAYVAIARRKSETFTFVFLLIIIVHCLVRITGFISGGVHTYMSEYFISNTLVNFTFVYVFLVLELLTQMFGSIFIIYAFLFLTRHWFLHFLRLTFGVRDTRLINRVSHALSGISFVSYILIVDVFVIFEVSFPIICDFITTGIAPIVVLLVVYSIYFLFEVFIVIADFCVGVLILIVGLSLSRSLKRHHEQGINQDHSNISGEQLSLSLRSHKLIFYATMITTVIFLVRGLITFFSIPMDLAVILIGDHCQDLNLPSAVCHPYSAFVIYGVFYLPMFILIYYFFEIVPLLLATYILFRDPSIRLSDIVPLQDIADYADLLNREISADTP